MQVLRDGHTSLLKAVKETDRREMIEAMIGRRMAEVGRPKLVGNVISDQPAIRWINAGSGNAFQDVSLDVRPGEVVALFGKLGSGATDVGRDRLRHPPPDGRRAWRSRAPRSSLSGPHVDAIDHGVGFLPADRKAGGAFLVRPLSENVAVANWPNLSKAGVITDRAEAGAFQRWREKLNIRSRNDPKQRMGTLSGGNQQKVLLGALAGARFARARAHRAHARRGCRCARGHLPVPAGAGRPTAWPCWW